MIRVTFFYTIVQKRQPDFLRVIANSMRDCVS